MKRYFGGTGTRALNLVASGALFTTVRLRLAFLAIKNRLLSRLRPGKALLANGPEAARQLQGYLCKGSDKLNIGGATVRLRGFINIDFVAYPEVEVVANLLDLAFIPNESIGHIHSNHFIEHITHQQLLDQLREYRRILKPNGLLTIRCPNALGVSYGFWFPVEPEQEQEQFTALGYPEDEVFYDPRIGWYHHDLLGLLHFFYGDRGSIDNQHLNIITPTKLRRAVEAAGFEVKKMSAPETTNIVLVARRCA